MKLEYRPILFTANENKNLLFHLFSDCDKNNLEQIVARFSEIIMYNL